MTTEQRRVINENPNLQSGVLSRLLGIPSNTIKTFRRRNNLRGKWTYSGKGVPFLRFDGLYRIMYNHEYVIACNDFKKAINVLDHLMWSIETGVMSDNRRIEHPYFEGLKL